MPQENKQAAEKIKPGLTLSETEKRLAELRRILAGNGKEQAKPDTHRKPLPSRRCFVMVSVR